MSEVLGTLCFRLTTHCNLACSFCRAGSSPSSREYADVQLFKRFVADARRYLGLKHVSISGGEPGLDPRLPNLVGWLTDTGSYVTVTTNGTSHLSRVLQLAHQMHPSKVRVRVSLDGDMKLHDDLRGKGTYAAAVREAQLVKRRFGWLGVNTVVSAELVGHSIDILAALETLRVDEWALITPVPEGSALGRLWLVDEIMPLIAELQKTADAAGFSGRVVVWDFLGTPNTSVLITARGDIVLSGVRGYDNISVGSLTDYSMKHIADKVHNVRRSAKHVHFSWGGWS